jgi:alkyl hydroperoxide reductase subunit AhpF
MRTVAGALGGFLEFLDHPVALELRDVVDEENAIEMVDLVLEIGDLSPSPTISHASSSRSSEEAWTRAGAQ